MSVFKHQVLSRRRRSRPAADVKARDGGRARARLIGIALLLLGTVVLCSLPASAEAIPQDLGSVQLFGDVKAQVDELTDQSELVQTDIDTLDDQLERTTEAYNQLQVQLDELNVRMIDLRRQLKAAQNDYSYRVSKYEDRVCDLYKSGGNSEFLDLLLAAEDGPDLFTRVRLAADQANQDRRLVESLEKSTERLNDIISRLDEAKSEELVIRQQMDDQHEDIRVALEERQATLATLDGQITAIVEQERKRQEEEQARIQAAIQAVFNGGQVYNGPLPLTDNETINQLLETATAYIGIPYVWAGDRPSTGMDCSGFTQFVYAQHGVRLPHYSGYQAEMGIPVTYQEMQPGDLLAFGFPVHHVGIYIGEDLFIHAPRTGDLISISRLSERGNLAAIRRFELQPRSGPPAMY